MMKHSCKSENFCFHKVGTALAFYGDWKAIEKSAIYVKGEITELFRPGFSNA